jgi:hypothetical protein
MRRRTVVLISILSFALAALHAQTQAPPRDAAQSIEPPAGTGGLSGIVKDQDGNPVRRCTVTISGDMRLDRTTVADDEGRFSFTSLPSGRFTVTAKKAGYPEMSYGAKRPFRTGSGVFVQDGQQVRDLALTLGRGGAIAGTVYDDRGQPMPGVPVMAWEVRTSLGGARTLDSPASGSDTVVTDDRGMYRVYGLPPGEYTIGTTWSYSGLGYDVRVLTDAEIRAAFQAANQSAAAPGAPVTPPPDPPRHNYSSVFSPGVTDPLGATTFSLAAGQERAGVDLRMQFVPMSGIEGLMLTPDGAPAQARLTIARRSPVQALNTTRVSSAQSGVKFSSGSLGPGPYTVMVEVPARPGAPALWAMADAMVGGDKPVAVSLKLQPALTATGRVVFDAGAAPPPADLSKVSIFLRNKGPMYAQTASAVDAAGAITMSGVIPGPYTISGSVPSGTAAGATWRVRSVVIDGTDVTDRYFEIGAGGATGLVVTFTDQVSELAGSLTLASGAPATDYFVVVLPADRAYWQPLSRRIVSARPDRAGRYVFRGLPAGDYRIALTTDLLPRDLQDVSALEQLAAQSVPVTLTTGEKKTMDLRPAGGGSTP